MKIVPIIAVFIILGCTFGYFLLDNTDDSDAEHTFPVINITTVNEERILSEDYYVQCTVDLSNTDLAYEFMGWEGEIRGRGNTSWTGGAFEMAKKSYKLQMFTPRDIMGEGSSDSWTLISNYSEPTACRNYFAYNVAQAVGVNFATTAILVNVYLNGIYEGVYTLCSQIEISEQSINITPYNTTVDTGYVIERNGWINSVKDPGNAKFEVGGKPYEIKDPMPNKLLTQEQYDYIVGYMTAARDSLYSGDYSQVVSYIDVDSFAKAYIVDELFNTQDVASTSFFMYKDVGGRLCKGPVWDFDCSSGNGKNDSQYADYLCAANNEWYGKLLEYPEYRALLESYLLTYEDTIRNTLSELREYVFENESEFDKNYDRWNIHASMIWSNSAQFLSIRNWHDHINYMYRWLQESLEFVMDTYTQ